MRSPSVPLARLRAGRSFVVEVAAVRREPGARRRLALEGVVEGLEVSGSHVPAGRSVRFDGLLEALHGGVLVTGTVRAPWEGPCRRCLEPAGGELVVAVREWCVEAGDPDTTYPLGPDELDLEPVVHDACILNLPLAPLCREGCRGLCPACGANRNLERCGCAPGRDQRWAVLASLAGGRSTGAPGDATREDD
ncbi:MAG TPA: DUF177 domain-containing protein [Acidimicrobiales bacterium]|nr:DUF177 domain-containing protein [Acidimicrobiales bacterium]